MLSDLGINPQQFERMTERLRWAKRHPGSAVEPSIPSPSLRHGIILGIDPSLRGTGWGVIRVERAGSVALAFDTIRCPASWSRTQCLVRIAAVLRDAIREHSPRACAIEGLFYAQNLQTALLMGEARGVCLLAAAEAGLETYEIAPRRVKQAIVGYGGAHKVAIARMVQRRLGLAEVPADDAADALALALAHAQGGNRQIVTPARRL